MAVMAVTGLARHCVGEQPPADPQNAVMDEAAVPGAHA